MAFKRPGVRIPLSPLSKGVGILCIKVFPIFVMHRGAYRVEKCDRSAVWYFKLCFKGRL